MKNLLFLAILLFNTFLFAQKPVNDQFQNAIALEINPTLSPTKSVNGTTFKADLAAMLSCDGYQGNDVFYSFVATQKQHIVALSNIIKKTNTEQNAALILHLYDENQQSEKCQIDLKMDSLHIYDNLTIGKKYVVQVKGLYDDYSFTISVLTIPPSPANDDCANAISLTPSNDWTCKNPVSGSTLYATRSIVNKFDNSFNDVWYSFTATAKKHSVYLENTVGVYKNNLDLALYVYASPCISDTLIYYSFLPNDPSSVIGGLQIGKKYWIRLSSIELKNAFFFDICVVTPSNQVANETCATAENLQVSPNGKPIYAKEIVSNYKQENFLQLAGNNDYINDPTWYKFTASSTKHIIQLSDITNISSNEFITVLAYIYEGNCTNLVYKTGFNGDFDYSLITEIGKTYFIQLHVFNPKSRAKLKIAVNTIPDVGNDECENALAMPVNPNLKHTITQKVDFKWATREKTKFDNVDVWYTFTATEIIHELKISNSNVFYKPYVALYENDCNNLVLKDSIDLVADTLLLLEPLVIGKKYYLKLIKVPAVGDEFQISIGTPPYVVPNDDIENAITILPSQDCKPNNIDFTWAKRTGLDPTIASCNPYYKSVWYKFVAQKTSYLLQIDTFLQDAVFDVLKKNASGKFEGIPNGCFQSNYTYKTQAYWVDNLTIGETYWIEAASRFPKTTMSFCLLEAQMPPTNDAFQNAENLAVNPTSACVNSATGKLAWATPEPKDLTPNCGGFEYTSDVWYKFTATSNEHRFRATFPLGQKDTVTNLSVYGYNANGDFRNYGNCSVINDFSTNELDSGKTYYIRVFPKGKFSYLPQFKLCITTVEKVIKPVNDECENAIVLSIKNANIIDTKEYSLTNATSSSQPSACSLAKDIWFNFIATDTINNIVVLLNQAFWEASSPNAYFEIVEGEDCILPFSPNCYVVIKNNPGFTFPVKKDKKYYIRIHAYTPDPIEIKASITIQKTAIPLVANDICSNAKNIPINTTLKRSTFLSEKLVFAKAEKTNLTKNICNGDSTKGSDIWYKFTATKANHYVSLFDKNDPSGFAVNDLFLEVYKGNCNAGFTSVDCSTGGSDNPNLFTFDPGFLLQNLNVGETYFIRIYSKNTPDYTAISFKISVLEINPSLQNCNTASNIVLKQVYENNTLNLPIAPFWLDNANNIAPVMSKLYKFKATSSVMYLNMVNVEHFSSDISAGKVVLFTSPCNNQPNAKFETYAYPEVYPFQNLEIDSTYYIAFYSLKKTAFHFNFYVTAPAIAPKNASCANALSVKVSPSMQPIYKTKDTIDIRFGAIKTKHYFEFKATAKQHFIYLKTIEKTKSGAVPFIAETWDDCSETKWHELKYIDSLVHLPLTYPDSIYKFVVTVFDDKSIYEVSVLTYPTPPANDECSGAMSLDAAVTKSTICSNMQHIVLQNASPDTVGGKFFSEKIPDQWYVFTAKSKRHTVKISNFKNFKPYFIEFNVGMMLFQGNNCNGLLFKKQVAVASNTYEGDTFFDNLEIGKKYYLKMASGNVREHFEFDLCMISFPEGPPNEDCKNSIMLVPNSTKIPTNKTNGTFKNAVLNQTYCGAAVNDVWYSFTATQNVHQLYFKKNALQNAFASVFFGDCDTLQLVDCFALEDTLSNLIDLTVGAKYLVQLNNTVKDTSQNLTFQTAIVTPTIVSKNSTCAIAKNIPVSTTSNVTQYVQDDAQYTRGLWYKFTATAKTHRIIFVAETPNLTQTPQSTFNPIYGILDKRFACNQIDTFKNGFIQTYLTRLHDTLSTENVINNLTIGDTYYLQIYSNIYNSKKPLPFKIGIGTLLAPDNTFCEKSKTIPINPTENLVNFLTENSKNVGLSLRNYFMNTGVLWYEFTATAKRHKLFINDITTVTGYYGVVSYSLTDENTCKTPYLSSAYQGGENAISGQELNNLTIGKKYKIKLDLTTNKTGAYGLFPKNAEMTYKIGLTTLPDFSDNDDCKFATNIPVNTSPQCQQIVHGSTLNASIDVLNNCSTSTNDDNVWFKFTATSERHFIQLKNIIPLKGDVVDMEYTIFEESPNLCSGFTQPLGCSKNRQYPLAPWKCEIGKTYYVSVYTSYLNSFSRCEFDICVSTPITNDDFTGAVVLPNFAASGTGFKSASGCSNSVTASSVGATYSFDAGLPVGACTIGALPKDIWFKTVVGDKKSLSIKVLDAPTKADVQMVAYRQKNGKLNFLAAGCPVDTLYSLAKGDTILLRVWNGTGLVFGNYTLCIESFDKISSTKETVCTNVIIHPIPATDYIIAQIDFVTSPTFDAKITNMTGQIVFQKQYTTAQEPDYLRINIQNLPVGTYILSIKEGTKMFVKKFVKI